MWQCKSLMCDQSSREVQRTLTTRRSWQRTTVRANCTLSKWPQPCAKVSKSRASVRSIRRPISRTSARRATMSLAQKLMILFTRDVSPQPSKPCSRVSSVLSKLQVRSSARLSSRMRLKDACRRTSLIERTPYPPITSSSHRSLIVNQSILVRRLRC